MVLSTLGRSDLPRPSLIAYRMVVAGIVVLTTGAMFLLGPRGSYRQVPLPRHVLPHRLSSISPSADHSNPLSTNWGRHAGPRRVTHHQQLHGPHGGLSTYGLSVATDGVTKGPSHCSFVNPQTKEVLRGSDGRSWRRSTPALTVDNGVVTKAEGYTIRPLCHRLTRTSAPCRFLHGQDHVKVQGITAFEGTKRMVYNKSSDTTNTATDVYWSRRWGCPSTVNAEGESLAQSWKQNVDWPTTHGSSLRATWPPSSSRPSHGLIIFRPGPGAAHLRPGFFLALTLTMIASRGKKLYRSFLLLPTPYLASSRCSCGRTYNQDFGLINRMMHQYPVAVRPDHGQDRRPAHQHVDGLSLCSSCAPAFAVHLRRCQGGGQDGRRQWHAGPHGASSPHCSWSAVALLLVSTFAFNFNNFNAIQLLTEVDPSRPGSTHAAELTSSSPWSTTPSAVPARTSDGLAVSCGSVRRHRRPGLPWQFRATKKLPRRQLTSRPREHHHEHSSQPRVPVRIEQFRGQRRHRESHAVLAGSEIG